MSDLTEIRDASRVFIADRDWQQFQDPKSILLALVGEVGELAELLQWLPADGARDRLREEPLHTRAAEEMADVLIYLVGLADQCGVDLGSAALAKIRASRRTSTAESRRTRGEPRAHPASNATSKPQRKDRFASIPIV